MHFCCALVSVLHTCVLPATMWAIPPLVARLVVRQQATSYSVVLNDANSAHDSHDTDYLVQHCTLYGNAMHIANTRSRTRMGKTAENLVRSSYNQIKSAIR